LKYLLSETDYFVALKGLTVLIHRKAGYINKDYRYLIISALEKIEDVRAVKPLIQALKDEDDLV